MLEHEILVFFIFFLFYVLGWLLLALASWTCIVYSHKSYVVEKSPRT